MSQPTSLYQTLSKGIKRMVHRRNALAAYAVGMTGLSMILAFLLIIPHATVTQQTPTTTQPTQPPSSTNPPLPAPSPLPCGPIKPPWKWGQLSHPATPWDIVCALVWM